jgi:dTDP-4-dehydrorhamnose reductase
MKRVLILGASGFIGQTLCTTLSQTYEVYGTYFTNKVRSDHTTMIKLNLSNDHGITHLLETIKPHYVISSLRGDFEDQLEAHRQLATYAKQYKTKVMFLSTANVFDSLTDKAHSEDDSPESLSDYGNFKIACENLMLDELGSLLTVLRLPMVFGLGSSRVQNILMDLKVGNPLKAYRDFYVSLHSDILLADQIAYLMDNEIHGVVHLGSMDVIKHEEMIYKLAHQLGYQSPNVQLDRLQDQPYYLALKSSRDLFPVQLIHSAEQVLESLVLETI